MPSPTRRFAPWLLALALAAPVPAAALPAFDPGALLARLRGVLSAIWGEYGCDVDPDGKCRSAPLNAPTTWRTAATSSPIGWAVRQFCETTTVASTRQQVLAMIG